MQLFKYFTITVVVLALVIPANANWFSRTFNEVTSSVKNAVKKVTNEIEKAACKFVYGVACPKVVAGAGKIIGSATSGMGTALVKTGVTLGKNACNVKRKSCKRSADEVFLPFSDEMSDYDFNGDKLITYQEFVWAVITTIPLADPDQLLEPFIFADFDGNGVLNTDEFKGAPFMFAHAYRESDNAVAA